MWGRGGEGGHQLIHGIRQEGGGRGYEGCNVPNATCCDGTASAPAVTFCHPCPSAPTSALPLVCVGAADTPMALIPPGTSPHALAGLLKQWLLGLPEPLLTYRWACGGVGG